ncbi:MAG TPA: DUF4129 domain-containing protein [Actinomycetota bacterium]|nr:DUF4129 domain-containing protein [Actinomycetota bacterium]
MRLLGARPALVVLSALVVWSSAAMAHAQEAGTVITHEEYERLLDAAPEDPTALDRLRAVGSVDGHPVDMDAVLGDASGEELDARLQALQGEGAGDATDASGARRKASELLAHRKYHPPDVPRPLRGALERMGEALEPIGRWFGRLAGALPGGEPTLWIALAIIILALVSLITIRAIRKSEKDKVRATGRADEEEALSLKDLEAAATAAEKAGDWTRALRLRFRAGLVRLARARVIPSSDVSTNGAIARELKLTTFSELAHRFDEVYYGGARASSEDVRAARRGWKDLLDQLAIR